jgi:MoxR-like ATPase
MKLSEIAVLAEKVKSNIQKVIVGGESNLDLLLTALICGGHVLLDDVPGTGKTVTAKSLARSLGCDFKRIQFTPTYYPLI